MSIKQVFLIVIILLFYIIGFIFGMYVKEKDYKNK